MRPYLPFALLIACGTPSTNHLGPADSGSHVTSDVTVDSSGDTVCGQPLPTSAPPVLSISGEIKPYPTALGGLAVTPVELWQEGASAPHTTAQSGDSNNGINQYAISVPTSGTPLRGYVRVDASLEFLDAYWFPATPLASDVIVPYSLQIVFRDARIWGFTDNLHLEIADQNVGYVEVLAMDCNGNSLVGASISVAPAGSEKVRYCCDHHGEWTSAPTPRTAIAYIKTSPGPITITTTHPTIPMRTTRVDVRANMYAIVDVKPL
jgi:hypothetical protein